jgi:cyclopropane-fatty-acyl-phospholipid synthase
MTAAERGWIPTPLLRVGIRSLLAQRLRDERVESQIRKERVLATMAAGPIAMKTEKANEQHYEVPSRFYELVLGPQLKYSSGFYPTMTESLAAGEEAMLSLTAKHAELADGQRILELGCGWGSLSLWMARNFRDSQILSVSNSKTQREFILEKARAQGLANIEVVTADMNDFSTSRLFDRIVSVEMFEHMRNYRMLLERIRSWAAPGAKLFIHIFTHRDLLYFFEEEGTTNWMGRHFFSGGLMPSDDLLYAFHDLWRVELHERFNGAHYSRTCEQWLAQLDRHRLEATACLGGNDPERQYYRWRLFFLACSELFAMRGGQEWGVSHYRLALS